MLNLLKARTYYKLLIFYVFRKSRVRWIEIYCLWYFLMDFFKEISVIISSRNAAKIRAQLPHLNEN